MDVVRVRVESAFRRLRLDRVLDGHEESEGSPGSNHDGCRQATHGALGVMALRGGLYRGAVVNVATHAESLSRREDESTIRGPGDEPNA
jgi:hypothetical protein